MTIRLVTSACSVAALLLAVAMPAWAQVVVGEQGAAPNPMRTIVAPQMPSGEPPGWLLKYLPDAKERVGGTKTKEAAKPAAAEATVDEKKALARMNLIAPEPVQQRKILTTREAREMLAISPWSPRAQDVDNVMWPELAVPKAPMVAPKLANAKPVTTRRDSALPPVLTPDLMDSMVLAAKELDARPQTQRVVYNSDTGAPVPLTPGDAQAASPFAGPFAEGAYSPSIAGNEADYVMGQTKPSAPLNGAQPQTIAAAATAEPAPLTSEGKPVRRLFSTDDGEGNKQARLLYDSNSEPMPGPSPQEHDKTVVLPTVTRREDELVARIDEGKDSDTEDSVTVPEITALDGDEPHLLASVSDDRPDVSAADTLGRQTITPPDSLKPIGEATEVTVEEPKTAPSPSEKPSQVLASIGQEVETPAAVPVAPVEVASEAQVTVDTTPAAAPVVAASPDDLDITAVTEAPRLLGRLSESTTVVAAPRVAVVKEEAATQEFAPVVEAAPEVMPEVVVETPEIMVEAPEVKVEAPEVEVTVDEPAKKDVTEAVATLVAPKSEPIPAPAAEPAAAPVDVPAKEDMTTAVATLIAPKEEPAPPPPVAEKPKKKMVLTETKPAPVAEVRITEPETPEVTVEAPEITVDTAAIAVEEPEIMVDAPVMMEPEPEPAPKPQPIPQPMRSLNAGPKPVTSAVKDMSPPPAAPEALPRVELKPEPAMPPKPLPSFAPAPIPFSPQQQTIVAASAPPPAPVAAPRPVPKAPAAPNLRVVTPPTEGAARLRTPKLVIDTPKPPMPATNVAMPAATPAAPVAPTTTLASITPDTPAPAAAPVMGTPATGGEAIYFTPGAKDLDNTANAQVDALAATLAASPAARVTLTAYADADQLVDAKRTALARALAIRSRLAAAGVQPTRIDVRALGEKPANDNGVADRVDVVVQ